MSAGCTFCLPCKFTTGEMVPVEDGEDLIMLPLLVYVYLALVFSRAYSHIAN